MSTAYNRRRGASARKMRKPRLCAAVYYDGTGNEFDCVRFAPVNRYCPEHQKGVRNAA